MPIEIERITGRKVKRLVTTLEEIDNDTGEITERDYIIDVQTINAEGVEALVPLTSEIASVMIQEPSGGDALKGNKKAEKIFDEKLSKMIMEKIPIFIKTMPIPIRELVIACSSIYRSVVYPYQVGNPLEPLDEMSKRLILSRIDVSPAAIEIFNLSDMLTILKNQVRLLSQFLGGKEQEPEEKPLKPPKK